MRANPLTIVKSNFNMHSFELKAAMGAAPHKIFAALTEPKLITKWEHFRWAQHDMRAGGRVRKRDDDGQLFAGEIVIFEPPFRYGVLWPVPKDTDDLDEGTFLVRMEFEIEAHGDKSTLTLKAEGFPEQALADREKISWGGFYLDKLRKVAES